MFRSGSVEVCAFATGGAERTFLPTRDSLQAYQIPDWFRDAKFGIWSHWGPQSAIEDGDWYARNMYMQGQTQYLYHCETYGHPSKVGYKDLVEHWKAEKWDPDHLMGLYKKAGAKYFFTMGVHHDNFDLWDSKYTRWNAVNMGPKKDVVGLWQEAARKHGLRFGVSEHLWISYKWFAVSHGADKTGPLAGVPTTASIRNTPTSITMPAARRSSTSSTWNDDGIPDSWRQHYLDRMTDLIDKYQPDLLYTDGHLPFEEYGLKMVSHLYNVSAQLHGGKVEAVYTSKEASDCAVGTCAARPRTRRLGWHRGESLADRYLHRAVALQARPEVQDGQEGHRSAHRHREQERQPAAELPAAQLRASWTSRRWRCWKASPRGCRSTARASTRRAPGRSTAKAPRPKSKIVTGNFNEDKQNDLTAEDVRFTTKGSTLYAFVMGWPREGGRGAGSRPGQPAAAGQDPQSGAARTQRRAQLEAGRCRVEGSRCPHEKISDIGITLKVELA